jgi:transposase
MFNLAPSRRIFIHAVPTDLRKSFDGLCGIVSAQFQRNILDGDYFVFFNRSLNRCKILLWDRDGLILVYKRLEVGRFQRPLTRGDHSLAIEVDSTTLTLILAGVDLASVKRRKRYRVEHTQQGATTNQ